MGEVYLAQHRRVARRAAIKVLVPELSQNAVVVDRFFNEARAASLIRHPGIVEILDCDLYLDQAYIVMELLEGESFAAYLYRTGPLDRDPAFFYGVSTAVASAVGAAHTTGIIHRDLKPDNIFLHLPSATDATVMVKILDFGIAKLAQLDGVPSQTGTGVLLGTPAYMSPEQCRGAGKVDNRSDIYSLGCILYEALAGGPPFVREGFGDLIVAHVAEPPPPLAQRVPGVAPDLDRLILRMLAKSPDDRPQTMDEVAAALRACARAANVSADPPLRGAIPVERPPERIESATTQPAAGAAGPSGAETAPLGPTPRGRRAGAEAGAASGPVPLDRSGRVVADHSGPHGSAPAGRMASQPSSGVPSAPGFAPGSTRVLTETANQRLGLEGPRTTTTFSSTAAEALGKPPRRIGRLAAIAGGAALALVGGIAIVATRPSSSPASRPGTEATSAAAVAPSNGVAPGATPAPPPPSAATPAPEPPKAEPPDKVRIDLQGAPPDTTAEIDGKAAPLPLELPRGPQLHRITLRAPGVPPRTLEIDGTRDRIVDMVVAAPPADAPGPGKKSAGAATPGPGPSEPRGAARERSPEREGSRRAAGGGGRDKGRASDHAERPAGGEKKAPAGLSDREAITDI